MSDDLQNLECPALVKAISILFPRPPAYGYRRIGTVDRDRLTLGDLETITVELKSPGAAAFLTPKLISALFSEAKRISYTEERAVAISDLLAAYVVERWDKVVGPLSEFVLANIHSPDLFTALPRLAEDPTLISALAVRIAHDNHFASGEACKALNLVRICNLQQARKLLVAIQKRSRREARQDWSEVFVVLFSSSCRGFGWTPWVKLFAILLGAPTYAEEPFADLPLFDPTRADEDVAKAYTELRSHVLTDIPLRTLAARLRDLLDEDRTYNTVGLLARSAETRAAYVASVSDACGSDVDFRRAAIEALLLLPSDRTVDFAQFAVTRLAHPSDKVFITDLKSHPERLVQYAAEAVRRVAFGSNLGQEIALSSAGSTMLET